MPARPGLLAVWNDIAAEDDAEFNAWYEDEHVPERLGVPGFLDARRYRDLAAPHSYAALYELASVAVLASPAYLARLADPTARTRAIMPRFRNMTRAGCTIGADLGALRAPGAVLACIELPGTPEAAAPGPLPAEASALRLRLALPDVQATQQPNPEARFRSAPDRLPAPMLLVEGDAEAAVRAAAVRLATRLGAAQPPRFYGLILARAA
jgi:hypothetical protein